jgi:hypothetical protein
LSLSAACKQNKAHHSRYRFHRLPSTRIIIPNAIASCSLRM